MVSFCVFLVAFTLVTAMKASLLPDDRYFNEEDPCDDFRYDGQRLQFAEVAVGERVFDSKNCGIVVPIDEVNTEIPVVKFSEDNETMYLVAMLDPDTPSFDNPLCRHWVHFIFGNVKVQELGLQPNYMNERGTYSFIKKVMALPFLPATEIPAKKKIFGLWEDYQNEYNPPNPQPGQGLHRFYFFVFEQKGKLVDGIHIANRCGFNVDGFIKDFDLKPVAMNMFRSEYQNVVVISELILT